MVYQASAARPPHSGLAYDAGRVLQNIRVRLPPWELMLASG